MMKNIQYFLLLMVIFQLGCKDVGNKEEQIRCDFGCWTNMKNVLYKFKLFCSLSSLSAPEFELDTNHIINVKH